MSTRLRCHPVLRRRRHVSSSRTPREEQPTKNAMNLFAGEIREKRGWDHGSPLDFLAGLLRHRCRRGSTNGCARSKKKKKEFGGITMFARITSDDNRSGEAGGAGGVHVRLLVHTIYRSFLTCACGRRLPENRRKYTTIPSLLSYLQRTKTPSSEAQRILLGYSRYRRRTS